MIDTDKYEGHPPAPWGWRHKVAVWRLTADGDKEWIDVQVDEDTDPTVMALIADAPLLLQALIDERAKVEMLRERLIRAYDWAENAVNGNDSAMMDYTEYVCGGEEE